MGPTTSMICRRKANMMTDYSMRHSLRCLRIHLAHRDPAWISLLGTEGVAWTGGPINLSSDNPPPVLILPTDTPAEVARNCRVLVSAGATAICEPGSWAGERLDQPDTWRMPYERECFCGLDGPKHGNAVEIEIGTLGMGMVFRLPFRLQPLWADRRRARRFVAIGDGQTIYEDMAAVVKKNVRRVIVDVIKRAFFERGLPYVHKWYFPGRNRSVLCFRGDADGGPRENFQRWLDTVRPFASCTSVFFCTNQYLHKRDLITAAASAGLEVGSHNHWHIVFPDRQTNRISLFRAQQVLSQACHRPNGFVAPAYFWHPTLYRLLEEQGYQYSSCFGVNHDGIPYFPVVANRLGSVLEIPYHCLGDRFPRFDIPLDSDTTRRFFRNLIEKKHAAGEPMFLYGHPDIEGRMGTAPRLLRLILETALSHSDVKPWHLSEYAAWWRRRGQCRVNCWYDSEAEKLACEFATRQTAADEDLRIRVEFSEGETYLVRPTDCPPPGQPRKILTRFQPAQMPAADDVGEVVYRGPDSPPAPRRRTIRRFLRAYSQVYLPWLIPRPSSNFDKK